MNRLLFVAGEPGSGKTESVAKPLRRARLGIVLRADRISMRAARYYRRDRKLGSKWQLWKREFDEPENHSALESAYLRSMHERRGAPIERATNVIVEGALCGHPAFRTIMCRLLPALGFTADATLVVALSPPWERIERNLESRGRPRDRPLEFVQARSEDYRQRLASQTEVQQYTSADDCYHAAAEFLNARSALTAMVDRPD